jgi:hypothetical protein
MRQPALPTPKATTPISRGRALTSFNNDRERLSFNLLAAFLMILQINLFMIKMLNNLLKGIDPNFCKHSFVLDGFFNFHYAFLNF